MSLTCCQPPANHPAPPQACDQADCLALTCGGLAADEEDSALALVLGAGQRLAADAAGETAAEAWRGGRCFKTLIKVGAWLLWL